MTVYPHCFFFSRYLHSFKDTVFYSENSFFFFGILFGYYFNLNNIINIKFFYLFEINEYEKFDKFNGNVNAVLSLQKKIIQFIFTWIFLSLFPIHNKHANLNLVTVIKWNKFRNSIYSNNRFLSSSHFLENHHHLFDAQVWEENEKWNNKVILTITQY